MADFIISACNNILYKRAFLFEAEVLCVIDRHHPDRYSTVLYMIVPLQVHLTNSTCLDEINSKQLTVRNVLHSKFRNNFIYLSIRLHVYALFIFTVDTIVIYCLLYYHVIYITVQSLLVVRGLLRCINY